MDLNYLHTSKAKIYIFSSYAKKQPGDDAARSMAYGPGKAKQEIILFLFPCFPLIFNFFFNAGLVEGIQEQPAEFTVETPPESDEKMEVKVIGPDGNELKGTDCVVTKVTVLACFFFICTVLYLIFLLIYSFFVLRIVIIIIIIINFLLLLLLLFNFTLLIG